MITKSKILIFSIPILLILFFWKNTLFNLSDQLYDWNDTVYFIWVIQNFIHHFVSLDFNHLFDATAMYPFKYALSFGEQFFFPSVIAFLISQFNQNPIFQLNILLVANHILVFVTFYLLVSLFVKNFWSKVISSFYISFSPYIFTQLGHFQMIFFWPLFLSLFFIFKNKDAKAIRTRNLVFAGLFLGIQFMSSIYLGTMGLVIIILFFTTSLFCERKLIFLSKQALILLAVFSITAGISIYGYILAKNEYGGKRELGEFITYSAHFSDYLFPVRSQTSILYQSPIFVRWKSFDHHFIGESAAFIGILPIIIIFLFLFRYKKEKNILNFYVNLNKFTLLLIFIGLISFIFSLGPRLSVNGTYLYIPLPYSIALKVAPLIEFLRALARWFSLVTLITALLVGLGLDKFFDSLAKKISQRNLFITGFLIFILFVVEFYPQPLQVSKKEWWSEEYSFMMDELCAKNSPAVLEYPFIYRNYDGNIIKDLQYKMIILLASTRHSCRILSGFSGYEPPEYIKIKEQLDNNGIDNNDLNLMRKLGFTYLKLNKSALPVEESISLPKDLDSYGLKRIYHNPSVDIYAL